MTAKRTKKHPKAPKRRTSATDLPFSSAPETVVSDFSLHDLFQQQTMAMLDRSDLSEEQKQSILVAMNCPCCGGSGLSFAVKLKRRKS